MQAPTNKAVNCFRQLYLSSNYADIEIKIGESTIKAHKLILMSQNVVFKSMFENDTVESQTNRIEITDTDEETFRIFLEYLYTGDLDTSAVTPKLLILADKYLEEQLKHDCEKLLCSGINYTNVIDRLLSAIQCQCSDLKKLASDFVARNSRKLKENPDFQRTYQNTEAVKSILNSMEELIPANSYTFSLTLRRNQAVCKKEVSFPTCNYVFYFEVMLENKIVRFVLNNLKLIDSLISEPSPDTRMHFSFVIKSFKEEVDSIVLNKTLSWGELYVEDNEQSEPISLCETLLPSDNADAFFIDKRMYITVAYMLDTKK